MDHYRTLLTRRADELTARSSRLGAHLRAPLEADSEEAASVLAGEEVVEALDSSVHHELDQVTSALARLDAGTFGVCLVCSQPIPPGRLEALPTATTCRSCAG